MAGIFRRNIYGYPHNEEKLPHKGVKPQFIAVVIRKYLLSIVATLPDATARVYFYVY